MLAFLISFCHNSPDWFQIAVDSKAYGQYLDIIIVRLVAYTSITCPTSLQVPKLLFREQPDWNVPDAHFDLDCLVGFTIVEVEVRKVARVDGS